jgi:hypothetical protein
MSSKLNKLYSNGDGYKIIGREASPPSREEKKNNAKTLGETMLWVEYIV